MNQDVAFTVYNAAAGAGKTYTLVKAYLGTLLKGEFKDGYKNILAITFTNKAVAEMKTRVLENLVGISSPDTPVKYKDILHELVVETKISEEKLKQKANRILKSILHNYAAFDIVTIDTFTHRVIRTFAHDLGIPMNFEIEMDTDVLIEEAIDSVIAKIGLDNELTRLIIDFAISKLEEDKSWDVTIELNKVAKLLLSENDRKHLNKLSDKTIDDFKELKKTLSIRSSKTQETIKNSAKKILDTIHNTGLEPQDFTRGSIPSHFQKLVDADAIDYKAAWKQDISNASFYSAKLDAHKKESIDSIRPLIEEAFLTTKQQLAEVRFFKNISKNLTPLSVLNTINKELIQIKKERRILLISEFNTIISKTVQDQPAPFIYERLGERYRDYFIDEFQDTSELQWNNLVPLIDNALASETLAGKRGKLTIVGDAKQAIYRWRGGKAEQFINLSSDKNPFSTKEKQVLNLPKNYRSHEEIIKFNNNLFTFLAKDLSDPKHQDLYVSGNKQEVNSQKNGYVNISFVEAKNIAEENEVYPQKVYDAIVELQEKNYKRNEICIIVRKQKEGAVIADFLSEKGIAIISSETLLIHNAPEVVFIIDLMSWFIKPDDLQMKIKVLHFLTEHFSIPEKHGFLQKMISADTPTFITELKALGVHFDFDQLAIRPLYDAAEYIIGCFALAVTTPAYLQFFLDTVFSYTQRHVGGIVGFLSYWDKKKDKLSIVAPETEDAIQIITIHKAKGLEFPCVIYPYANIDLYREIEPKTWYTIDNKERYSDFEEVFIDYSKNITDFGVEAQEIVAQRQAQLELDTFNLLYVVLTRAKEQLYVFSKLEINSKGEHNPNKFSGKLISYLQHLGLWNQEKTSYTFGDAIRPSKESADVRNKAKVIKLSRFEDSFKSYKVNIVTNSGRLWDTSQKDAIERGNLIHNLMASIITIDDIHKVVEKAHKNGEITVFEKETLGKEIKKIVTHPELLQYFSHDNTVYNERDIVAKSRLFRPDRVVIDKSNNATIIDYKTGAYSATHAAQLQEYAEIIETMEHPVVHRILIYFNEDITLKYV